MMCIIVPSYYLCIRLLWLCIYECVLYESMYVYMYIHAFSVCVCVYILLYACMYIAYGKRLYRHTGVVRHGRTRRYEKAPVSLNCDPMPSPLRRVAHFELVDTDIGRGLILRLADVVSVFNTSTTTINRGLISYIDKNSV